MKKKLSILFAASELTPIAKVGGLGDVAGALPKALESLGADVRLVLPFYGIIDRKKFKPTLLKQGLKLRLGDKMEEINLWQAFLPQSRVLVYLLENKKYFGENGVYFEKSAFCGSFAEIARFLAFSQAIVQLLKHLDSNPQIIHLNDWHVSAVPALLKLAGENNKNLRNIKTLLTIHNLANQGRWAAKEILEFLKFDPTGVKLLLQGKQENDINLFRLGILTANRLNTVSQTYAREIFTEEFGAGLADDLKRRRRVLTGIQNGIDTRFFNPKTDRSLIASYGWQTIERKRLNKEWLLKKFHLNFSVNQPLFGLVSRLTWQKGIDLIAEAAPKIIDQGGGVVFLGVGDERLEKRLLDLSLKYPQKAAVVFKFDPSLASRIYAGSDVFLMPSRFEPCGLGQMIAMRYGTVPLVRAVGGLRDTVKNVTIKKGKAEGNGVVFKNFSKKEFIAALEQVFRLYENKKIWRQIMENGMKEDFSWERSAKKYLELYGRLSKG